MLGGYANKDFFDFFWYRGRPGLFWICQAGCSCRPGLSGVVPP
jgi:hypothetical protein